MQQNPCYRTKETLMRSDIYANLPLFSASYGSGKVDLAIFNCCGYTEREQVWLYYYRAVSFTWI